MVILDATVVNVALPSIEADLGFSAANLQWVINGYTLIFGGFLLLGGRAGDLFGRRRLFLWGGAIFSFASLLNGLATSDTWLVASRGLQGLGARSCPPRRCRSSRPRSRRATTGRRRSASERDRRRRRRVRPAARGHPHRPAELGVDRLRQRADRGRHGAARDPLRAGVPSRGCAPTSSTCRAPSRSPRDWSRS
jgi:hypothetical protein